ncbi:AfsR/SARP family transcriptional regulator [Nocardioides speluncae]|uniref:AfsR/SARP family transcriptional regulator n=1 Tax=Nocardioides speluncae TaxID=2670337 RepID=UPI001379D0C6|nr:BTAD domain-containing putative transcriptional regulator [Nocardioides speluncae]
MARRPAAGTSSTAALHVALLGPVEALVDGAEVALSPLERNLLVLLALTPGSPTSTDRLIDQMWGDALPAAPRSRIQGLVSSLRRKVGSMLVTRYPGYLLDRTQLARDVDTCDELAAAAASAPTTAERAELYGAALDQWRGEPLDGATAPGLAADRARLGEQRVGLLEAHCEAELELGNHAGVIAPLAASSAEHPLRERLAGLHMTALYRSNRQADALLVYQELRERLVDELGSDPCADLRNLHAAILRGEGLRDERRQPGTPPASALAQVPAQEPPAAVPSAAPAAPVVPAPRSVPTPERVPAQLPAGVGQFVGREDELHRLAEAVDRDDGEPKLVVVSGTGGLGKTALVLQWAHGVADRHRDGQVFLDLHGDDPTTTPSPEDAVAAALTALGAPELATAAPADRVAAYRTSVRNRRLLIVADNAGSVDQVLALVPPGDGNCLVVTSRRRLITLATHHRVHELLLGPLDDARSRQLLEQILGADRLRDPDADALVRWCGGWPLTIRHAATKLLGRPSQTIDSFLREAHDDGDNVLLDGDPRSVGEALRSAHRQLSPSAARLFGRLGLHDGPSICLHLAAAAADTSLPRARRLLDELVAARLIEETTSGRFRFHNVVARFASQRGHAEELTPPVILAPHSVANQHGTDRDCLCLRLPVPA